MTNPMKMKTVALGALLAAANSPAATGFSPPTTFAGSRSALHMSAFNEPESFDPLNFAAENSLSDTNRSLNDTKDNNFVGAASVAFAAAILSSPSSANAAGPDWGLFEGRTGSLLHPIMMGSMFLLSVSTGLKGFQYRRQRTMGDEISALRKTIPDLGAASSVAEAIKVAESAEEVDTSLVASLRAAIPVEKEVQALVSERKELASKGLRDSHFSQGATLAFLGTAFAIEGPLNTYARAGKLFPGPHLYAGAGLVVLWAAAAACVPAMQKGNDTARSIHIGANVAGTGLFAWQVVTGWPILLKVTELTKWP